MSQSWTNQFISDEYSNALHTQFPLSSAPLNAVYDGIGNRSSLSIGISATSITGSLTAGNVVFPVLPVPTNLLDLFFSVGDVKITTTNVNPGLTIGGTWASFAPGRFLVGVGTGTDVNNVSTSFASGNNNGEYQHRLTIAEMPSHAHNIILVQASQADDNAQGINLGTSNRAVNPINLPTPSLSGVPTGGGLSHNNIVPSYGVYFWRRTA